MFKDHKRNLKLHSLQLRHTKRGPDKVHYLNSSHNLQLMIKATLRKDHLIVHMLEKMNYTDNNISIRRELRVDKAGSLRCNMQVKLSLTEYINHLSNQVVLEYQALKPNLGITILVGRLPFHF